MKGKHRASITLKGKHRVVKTLKGKFRVVNNIEKGKLHRVVKNIER